MQNSPILWSGLHIDTANVGLLLALFPWLSVERKDWLAEDRIYTLRHRACTVSS